MSTDQDPDVSPLQENSPGFDFALSRKLLEALHLNSTSISSCGNHQPATMEQRTKYSCNKRQSPSSLSPQQPSPKRTAVQQPSSSTKFFGDQLFHGFTKIPLPSSVLSRTLSAPVPSQGTKNLRDQSSNGAAANSLINTHLPQESSGVNSVPVATPSRQPLYRSFSDPNPGSYQVMSTSTPPKPLAAGEVTLLPPSTVEASGLRLKRGSPDAKRLKRMMGRLREMSKWWNEVIKEGEEDAGAENNDHCLQIDHNSLKDDSEASQVSETEDACQEAVWVEKRGEVLILHFRCPCREGYQILLSRNDCYYKLTSF